jgi:hypothetical protein
MLFHICCCCCCIFFCYFFRVLFVNYPIFMECHECSCAWKHWTGLHFSLFSSSHDDGYHHPFVILLLSALSYFFFFISCVCVCLAICIWVCVCYVNWPGSKSETCQSSRHTNTYTHIYAWLTSYRMELTEA